MLGKLMKYEWRGLRFPIIIMLAVLGCITALTCGIIFTINPDYDVVFSSASLVLSILLYYFGVMACVVGMILIFVIRFYKTCYTDQGYLTHTLPTTPGKLLAAKTVSAMLCYLLMLLWIAVTVIVLIAAAYIHAVNLNGGNAYQVDRVIAQAIYELRTSFERDYGISLGLFLIFCLIYMIIGSVCAIMTALGCISLGQLYAKHRVVGAIIAYVAIFAVKRFISYLGLLPTYSSLLQASSLSEDVPMLNIITPTHIITLILEVALSVVMYLINLHMMTKRLNLE